MRRVILLFAAVIMGCISAAGFSEQKGVNPSAEKSYIYCIASFDYMKVAKKDKKEYVLTMKLECRQYDEALTNICGVVNDEEGKPQEFASKIVGINWLGRMGWELITYPTQYRQEHIEEVQYWFRMDVTGLSPADINLRLEKLKTVK